LPWRIIDRPFLSKGNDSILVHGVTLLLGDSGGFSTSPVTPPSSYRHPVSSVAPTARDADAYAVLGPALKGFSPTPEMPEIAEALALMERLA
jgi:hypothetical protein